jgi:hypothetical protein
VNKCIKLFAIRVHINRSICQLQIMKYKSACVATACLILGSALGMAASDYATLYGFPHGSYILEIKLEPTTYSEFTCTKLGAFLGPNLSGFDFANDRQKNCILLVSGKPKSDGSFDAFPLHTTWYGRILRKNTPIGISKDRIKSFEKTDFWM